MFQLTFGFEQNFFRFSEPSFLDQIFFFLFDFNPHIFSEKNSLDQHFSTNNSSYKYFWNKNWWDQNLVDASRGAGTMFGKSRNQGKVQKVVRRS